MPTDERLGDRLRKQIREIYSVASEKTEEYARIGKKRLDILSLSRDVAREKRALGDRVYDLSRREEAAPVLDDVTVKAILGRISRLEEEIREREAEILKVRQEARRARDQRAETLASQNRNGDPGVPFAGATEDAAGVPTDPPDPAEDAEPRGI